MQVSATSPRLSRGRSTPEIRAIPSPLSPLLLFVLRVLANDVHSPPALNHLALFTSHFHRRSNLHEVLPFLPPALSISIGNPPAGRIVGREFHFHPVARENPDKVDPHLPRDMRQHSRAAGQLDPEHGIGQHLDYRPLYLDRVLLRHPSPRPRPETSSRTTAPRRLARGVCGVTFQIIRRRRLPVHPRPFPAPYGKASRQMTPSGMAVRTIAPSAVTARVCHPSSAPSTRLRPSPLHGCRGSPLARSPASSPHAAPPPSPAHRSSGPGVPREALARCRGRRNPARPRARPPPRAAARPPRYPPNAHRAGRRRARGTARPGSRAPAGAIWARPPRPAPSRPHRHENRPPRRRDRGRPARRRAAASRRGCHAPLRRSPRCRCSPGIPGTLRTTGSHRARGCIVRRSYSIACRSRPAAPRGPPRAKLPPPVRRPAASAGSRPESSK